MKTIFRSLLLILLLCFHFEGKAQLSKKHYIPPFYGNVSIDDHVRFNEKARYDKEFAKKNIADGYDSMGYFTIYLSTNETTPFDVIIRGGDGTVLKTIKGLSSSNSDIYKVPTLIYEFLKKESLSQPLFVKKNDRGKVLQNKGLILEGDHEFFVNLRIVTRAQGASLTSKGMIAAGTHFFAGFMRSVFSPYNNNNSHFISMIALENNTELTISDRDFNWFTRNQNSLDGWTNLGGNKYSRLFNKGETITLGYDASNYRGSYNYGDEFDAPNGTEIESTKPIVVNTGSWASSTYNDTRRDIGFDQIVPSNIVGSEYILVRGQGNVCTDKRLNWKDRELGDKTKHGENVMVIATEANTEVKFYNNKGKPFKTHHFDNKGDACFFDFEIYGRKKTSLRQSVYFTSTKPVYVYQTMTGSSTAPQTNGMSFIPPLKCTSDYKVTIPLARAAEGEGRNKDQRLNTVIKGSTKSKSLRIRNSSSEVDPADITYYNIGGVDNWFAFSYNIDKNDDYVIENINMDPINVALYGESGNVGSAGYYSGFGTRPLTVPELAVDGAVESCGTNTRIVVANNQPGWRYRWYKNESVIAGAEDPSYTTTGSGFYAVEAILDCDGKASKTYPSDPIFLSPCLSVEASKSAQEGERLDVHVSLSESIPVDVSYDLELVTTTGEGSAQRTKDFQVIGTLTGLTIPANQTTKTISFDLIDDAMREPDETFAIRVTRCSVAKVNIGTCLVTIKDNDLNRPTFTMELEDDAWKDGINEDGSEGKDITVKIRLAEKSGYAISVDYAFVDKTAKRGEDYQAIDGTLSFAPEEQEKEIHFRVLNDALYDVESSETFGIRLSNVVEASLSAMREKQVSIVDDERKPQFYVTSSSVLTAREGEPLQIRYRLEYPMDTTYISHYATETSSDEGFATAGADYVAIARRSFTIPKGATEGTAEVTTLEDGLKEPQEKLYFTFDDSPLAQVNDRKVSLFIIDTDAKPQLTFASEVKGKEGDIITVTLTLTSAVDQDVAVQVRYLDGTAKKGEDYRVSTTSLTIPRGTTSATFTIPTIQDTEEEGDEMFYASVATTSSLVELPNANFTTVIEDDDSTPVARDDYKSIDEGKSLSFSFAENDSPGDIPIQGYKIVSYDFPDSEIEFDRKTGNFKYTPSAHYSGTHTLTYYFFDADGDRTRNATVTVTVKEVDDVPVAIDDMYTISERTSLDYHKLSANVLANDEETGDGVTVSLVEDVRHGTLKLNSDGTFEYEPDAQFFSTYALSPTIPHENFTYKITDQKQSNQTSTAKCQVSVRYYNNFRPKVVDDHISTNDKTPVSIDPLQNDIDRDGVVTIDKESFAIVSKSGAAAVSYEKGLLKITPVDGVEETVVVEYQIKDLAFDGQLSKTSNVGRITIVISRTNRIPVAVCGTVRDFYLSKSGNPVLEARLLDNGSTDPDGDDLDFKIESSLWGSQSSVVLNCDYLGVDIPVTLVVTDTNGASSRCSTHITVKDTITPKLDGFVQEDLTYSIPKGATAREVFYNTPMYLDNCGGRILPTRTSGAASGSSFGIGSHLILFEASDASGNRGKEISFTIHIMELTPKLSIEKSSRVLCEGESCELGVDIKGGIGNTTIAFYLDGLLFPDVIFSKNAKGVYSALWLHLPKGDHQIKVKVTDESGTISESDSLPIDVKGKPNSLKIKED
ncbi:HYR domain-containing protein [Halosquirtibacter laminarini]|uniref:HYR domain-containing protein n=1 Tax=Halosquirtibacter laminarini TaxID=3374600 RepID=A0AC61NJE3_9BACT|nr:HYR domain-containing protein [Prolixibacteraceae bacterium]